MARTKRSRRSYGASQWGRNRVRVFPDLKTGIFQIEWRENGRRLTRSLKHHDWGFAGRRRGGSLRAGAAAGLPSPTPRAALHGVLTALRTHREPRPPLL